MEPSPDVQPLGPSPADIYLRTHDALKKEISTSIEDARATERNTLLLSGATYAFLSGRCPIEVAHLFWFIPAFFAAFGALRVAALMISIRPRAMYLRLLETTVLKSNTVPSWEVYFRTHYRRGVGISMIIFWAGLLAATLWIPWYLPSPLCK